jgi:hypothetical protein
MTQQEAANAHTIRGKGAEVQVERFRVGSAFVCDQSVLDKIVDALMGEPGFVTVFRLEHCRGGGFVAQPRL